MNVTQRSVPEMYEFVKLLAIKLGNSMTRLRVQNRELEERVKMLEAKVREHDRLGDRILRHMGENAAEGQEHARAAVGEIRGVCVSTGAPCKTCTALLTGRASRKCRFAYSGRTGHLHRETKTKAE